MVLYKRYAVPFVKAERNIGVMKRRIFLWILGVFIFVGTSLGVIAVRKKRFPGFPGVYMCNDFGIPARANPFLYISEDGAVLSDHYGSGPRTEVGRLTIETRKQALFELNESVIQAPNIILDPSAIHYFVAFKQDIQIVGTKDGNEVYSYICTRKK